MRKDSGAINIVHNYHWKLSAAVAKRLLFPTPAISMSREFIAGSTEFPLKRLESGNKNSTDVESELTEDKQEDEHVQPLGSGELW